MKKYSCFVISPIGEEGTEIFQEYTDLFELIITPAMEVFDIDVARGDHFVSEERIDDSVIAKIQDADICICDISVPNPNVYYELGRRDETGKPVILLKRKGSSASPVDIATRRFIEYDYDGRYAIRDAQNHIRQMVAPLIEQGFEKTGRSATLGDLADTLTRLERKFDKFLSGKQETSFRPASAPVVPEADDNSDPMDRLKYAIRTKNIPMAEQAMEQLKYRMETIQFYDMIVEPVAALGSSVAGTMLLEYAETFMFNTAISYKKKIDYLSYMISYATKVDAELENLELFESLFDYLLNDTDATEIADAQKIDIYNQKNRLYYGIYASTKDVKWLDMAIEALLSAINIEPQNFLYHNASVCYLAYAKATNEMEYYVKAKTYVEKCLELDPKDNADHLLTACRIFHKLDDPQFSETYERLKKIAPIVAANFAYEIK